MNRYNESEKIEFAKKVKEYIELRRLGMKVNEIEDIFQEKYQQSVFSYRRAAELLDLLDKVEVKIDSEVGVKKLALAKNKILIDRKINTKQRNLLNKDANIIAFRELINKTLVDYDWKTYKVSKNTLKMHKNPTFVGSAVYIIADEHYKGACDTQHINDIYDNIQEDIKKNKYVNVELWYLGDSIDGLIHTGSLASNEGAILPCIEYCNILIERINKISQVRSIKFVCKSNHTQTRPLGTSRNELAREDLGYVIANTLKLGLRKDIELNVNDIIMFNYKWLKIALLHGHQPYTKTRATMIEYWSSKYGIVPDMTLMGHYHTFKVSEFGKNKWLIVAPTAKNFNGDFEHENGYISSNQFLKLTFADDLPVFTPMSIRKE